MSSAKRAASIFIKEQTFFAFLEAKDYQKVLKQADMQDIQTKVAILRENRFFQKMSVNRL